ncbi:MAG: patatin-like phospholipase family protein [Bacillota bacterium]
MVGLVLEGGGAKGSYQIGAYKALREMGIEIGGVAGTSIGALNGAMIVQNDLDKAYDLWYNIAPSKLFDMEDGQFEVLRNLELNTDHLSFLLSKAKTIVNNRGIDITQIKKIIEENINEEKLRSSKMDFGIVTVSLTDKKPLELFLEDIPAGKVVDYLMASAYFPAFKMEKIDGKYFIDGAFHDNMPINLLVSKGYKDIIVIRSLGLGRTRRVKVDGLNITYISPSEFLCRTLDFSQSIARKNLKLGYYDALKVFKGLKGQTYYIESKKNETFFLDFLLNLGEQGIRGAGETLGIDGDSYRRILLEFVIPRIAEYLEIPKDGNYEDVVIRMLEIAACTFDIERFHIYDFESFVEAIRTKYKPNHEKATSNMPKFIKQNELLSRVVKDQLVKDVVLELLSDFLQESSEITKSL